MRKKRGEKIMWMLKSLLASYIVTGLLLLGLTFLVYKFELDEQVVVAGIVAIYIVSTFVGGYIIGKLTGVKKYIWGMPDVLMKYRIRQTNGISAITTAILCIGGGTMGGMLS